MDAKSEFQHPRTSSTTGLGFHRRTESRVATSATYGRLDCASCSWCSSRTLPCFAKEDWVNTQFYAQFQRPKLFFDILHTFFLRVPMMIIGRQAN